MTLRTKLAAFHARIHSHRHNHGTGTGGGHHHHHHHFHLPHLKHKSSKDSKDKSSSSSSSSPSRNPSKSGLPKSSSPSRNPSKRNSLSSTSTTSSSSTVLNPVLTLIIPTQTPHHNHTIEARVYHPTDFPASYGLSPHTPRKAAVIAHPYATLGGTWDDPVVLSLVSLLTRRGWVVATFNFCGAGNSKGKTSWTGNQEREEYATVTSFLVKYVECIDPHAFTISTTTTTTTTTIIPDIPTSTSSTSTQPPKKQPIKVLLAGYSYGSLIASRTPSANRILKTIDKDILAYATRTAYEWASTEKRRSFAMVRGAALGRSVWANNDDDDDEEGQKEEEESGENSTSNKGRSVDEKVNYNVQLETETSWLLVSPILPPVSMFLNIPNPMSWFPSKKRKEEEEVGEKEHLEDEPEDEREVLAVYGSDDMFTGVGRYRSWTKGKVERSGGRFRGVEVDGAGHFWMQEEEWMVKLREGVARWIDEKSGVGV